MLIDYCLRKLQNSWKRKKQNMTLIKRIRLLLKGYLADISFAHHYSVNVAKMIFYVTPTLYTRKDTM